MSIDLRVQIQIPNHKYWVIMLDLKKNPESQIQQARCWSCCVTLSFNWDTRDSYVKVISYCAFMLGSHLEEKIKTLGGPLKEISYISQQ